MTFIGTKIHVKKINKNSSYKSSSKKLKFRLQWLKKVLAKTQTSGPKILVTISQKVLSNTKIWLQKSQKVLSNTKFRLQYHKKFFQTQNSGYNITKSSFKHKNLVTKITKSSFKHKILVTISQKVLSNTKFWLQYHKKFFQIQNSGYNITKSYLQN